MTDSGFVIIGSGPAAVSAAQAFRKHNGSLPVTIISSDRAAPYERPPLSKDFLRGETDDVALHPPAWFSEQRIDLVLGTEVERVDPDARVVVAAGEPHSYSALLLATGAQPSPLEVTGGQRALLLRSFADADRLRTAATAARSAVVIGAGFIGCEAAASLSMRGISVTLVAPQDVPQEKRLGSEAGRELRKLVEAAGVRYMGGVSVEAVHERAVQLDSSQTIDGDLVVAATGVTPCSALAEAAGVDVDQGRILVGADMSTSAPNIYAAGDVALAHNSSAGRRIAVEHWQDADDHGSVAGASAAGVAAEWDGVPGFWTTIGDRDVKYHAWGDGYETSRFVPHGDGFTVWYQSDGRCVGVLTLNADDDYDRGEELIKKGDPAPTHG